MLTYQCQSRYVNGVNVRVNHTGKLVYKRSALHTI